MMHPVHARVVKAAHQAGSFTVDALQAALLEADLPHTSRGYAHQLASGRRVPTPDEWGVVVDLLPPEELAAAWAHWAGTSIVRPGMTQQQVASLAHAADLSATAAQLTQAEVDAMAEDSEGGREVTQAEHRRLAETAEDLAQRCASLGAHHRAAVATNRQEG